jgi:molybdate transport system substrate-binding protein
MTLSAGILFALGLLHLVYTFWGSKLTPRDPALRVRMSEVSPVMKRLASSVVALLAFTTCAHAAELKLFTVRAITTILWEIGPEFERTTGHKLDVVTGFSPAFAKQIRAGEAFDLVFAPGPAIDALIKDGLVTVDSRTPMVKSDAGVEVRAGAPKPNIATVEAFKQTLLNAKSIAYLPMAGVPQLIERLGLTEALKAKSVVPNADIVSELVAKGEVELGIIVVTQILTTPGVELVGPLPPELRITSSFVGAISSQAKAPEAARELIAFLKTPAAVKVMRAQGMEPLFE